MFGVWNVLSPPMLPLDEYVSVPLVVSPGVPPSSVAATDIVCGE